MKTKPTLIHIYPNKGGVFVYSQVVSNIYKQQGLDVVDVVVDQNNKTSSITKQLREHSDGIYHFEAGAGDSKILEVARKTLGNSSHKQIMTVHDTAQFVRHPLDNHFTRSHSTLLRISGKLVRKALSIMFGKRIRVKYMQSNNVILVYLRKDLAVAAGVEYLPQPVYTQGALSVRKATIKPVVIGYGGYWGQYKGLETIIEAWRIGDFSQYKLVVSGGTAEKNDAYSSKIRKDLLELKPKPELPGFVTDLDKFLLSLDVLLLPYWPELPSGTSAMALRAAELAVPIIASNTPALYEQLGDIGPVYIKPKDAKDLAQAIERLTGEWANIQQEALQLSKRINRDHSWRAVGKRLMEIIEKT